MSSQLESQAEQDARYSDIAADWKADPKKILDPTFRNISESIKSKNSGATVYRPGTELEISGKRYKVEADGDTLTEIPSGK